MKVYRAVRVSHQSQPNMAAQARMAATPTLLAARTVHHEPPRALHLQEQRPSLLTGPRLLVPRRTEHRHPAEEPGQQCARAIAFLRIRGPNLGESVPWPSRQGRRPPSPGRACARPSRPGRWSARWRSPRITSSPPATFRHESPLLIRSTSVHVPSLMPGWTGVLTALPPCSR